MNNRYRRARFGSALMVFMLCGPLAGTAFAAPPAPRLAPRTGAYAKVPAPHPMTSANTGPRVISPNVVTSYTITDVGAPSGYYLGSPAALNNTGQIFGNATIVGPLGYQHCLAWTGTAWVDAQGPKALNCYAAAIGDKSSTTLQFQASGTTNVPTDNSPVALYTSFTSTTAKTKILSSNVQSQLTAMNKHGVAIGTAYYSPYGGFSYNVPPFISTSGSLAVLQPQCVTAKPGCLYYPSPGRAVNANGVVLGNSLSGTGAYIEYKPGSTPTYTQFDLPPINAAYGSSGPTVGMDDSGNVPYYAYDPTAMTYDALLYKPASGTATNLGSLAGNSCKEYLPIAVNGPGKILGTTANCTNSADNVYWTWDATNGMVNVNAGVTLGTQYNYLYAYGLNDLGQILIQVYNTTTSKYDWGWLTPGATMVHSAAAKRTIRTVHPLNRH